MRIGAESEPLPFGHSMPRHMLPRLKRTSSPVANVCPFTCSRVVQGESADRPSFLRAALLQSTKYATPPGAVWAAEQDIAQKSTQTNAMPSDLM